MRIPLKIPCGCGSTAEVETFGESPFPGAICKSCGLSIYPLDSINYASPVTERLLLRIRAELEAGDYSLVILLSAVAVESEVAYTFFKWKGLELRLDDKEVLAIDEEKWEKELRNKGIADKLDYLSNFLVRLAFNEYVARCGYLPVAGHKFQHLQPSAAKETLIKSLFWKRNRIVHFGKISFEETRCQ